MGVFTDMKVITVLQMSPRGALLAAMGLFFGTGKTADLNWVSYHNDICKALTCLLAGFLPQIEFHSDFCPPAEV